MALNLRSKCCNLNRIHQFLIFRSFSSSPSISKMRFIQFTRKNDHRKRLGVVSEDGASFVELSGGSCVAHDMISFINQNISMYEIADKIPNMRSEPVNDSLRLLPPITHPGKIVCVGLNYKDHCEEQDKPVPTTPIFFSKLRSSLIGPTDDIVAHKTTKKLDWEVELAVIIGKRARNVSRTRAMDHVFGYTIAQDISARDWQKELNGGQFLIGKSMDTFCPLGPALVHKSIIPDPYNLCIKTRVNGVLMQNGNTKDMVFKIDDVINRITRHITLEPGDVILTGTPKGVGMHRKPPVYLKPGDIVKSEIQCMGKLINEVVAP